MIGGGLGGGEVVGGEVVIGGVVGVKWQMVMW